MLLSKMLPFSVTEHDQILVELWILQKYVAIFCSYVPVRVVVSDDLSCFSQSLHVVSSKIG